MRNFKKLVTGLDTTPLLSAVSKDPHLFDQFTLRQSFPGSPHQDTQAIVLRGPRDVRNWQQYTEPEDVVDWPLKGRLSRSLSFLDPLLDVLHAEELGYVMLVKLLPEGHVLPHRDEGTYAEHFSRFHVGLTFSPGAYLLAGGESAQIGPGEAWWFDHRVEHEAFNADETPRIHLIFDAVVPALGQPTFPK